MHLRVRVCDDLARKEFVLGAGHLLEGVRERPVPDVVEQRSCQDETTRVVLQWLSCDAVELSEELLGNMQYAEGMGKTTVVRARENQLGETELLDAPQALHFGSRNQFKEQAIPGGVLKYNQVVDGIAKKIWARCS